jgi:hypothetical protein
MAWFYVCITGETLMDFAKFFVFPLSLLCLSWPFVSCFSPDLRGRAMGRKPRFRIAFCAQKGEAQVMFHVIFVQHVSYPNMFDVSPVISTIL